jgi:metal-responsive CopG/Arc/MetJ family transcriptional regulator
MKTTICLPDELVRDADALASRLGVSRSTLYATALAEYVAMHRTGHVTERLNAVYRVESSELDRAVAKAQKKTIRRSQW